MHMLSLIILAAVIPAALSHPVLSNSLIPWNAGNQVAETRSVDVPSILEKRGQYDEM